MSESESPIDPPTDLVPPVGEPTFTGPTSIERIIASAIEQGRSGVELQGLLDLYERMQAKAAEREYNNAFARFKADCPPVKRLTENAQFTVTRDGVKKASMYADLETIAATIRKSLADNGLSYHWTDVELTDKTISLTCILSHVSGHSRSATATFPTESRAGASPQQKWASTITYCRRHSLIDVTGLSSCDVDDDGAGPGNGDDPESKTLAPGQVAQIHDLIETTGTDVGRFGGWIKKTWGVDSIGALPSKAFPRVLEMLYKKQAKREQPPQPEMEPPEQDE